jgi:hypothetical protein
MYLLQLFGTDDQVLGYLDNHVLNLPSRIDIREPEIAECSKNARICNILLEIFHVFFIFHKKNYFSIFVFVASVNLSICTNKSSFHNYFYTYPLFF